MLAMYPLGQESSAVLRTKRWLYEALGDLMKTQPFADITVGQICKYADVSRAVFYNHYDNKEDLLCEIFQRIVAVYWAKVRISAKETGKLKCRTGYLILCKELMRNQEFFCMLDDNNYSWLLVGFFMNNHLKFYAINSMTPPLDKPEYRKYFVPYHATAMAHLLLAWLRDGSPIPPEQMADVALRLWRSCNVDTFLTTPQNKGEPQSDATSGA